MRFSFCNSFYGEMVIFPAANKKPLTYGDKKGEQGSP